MKTIEIVNTANGCFVTRRYCGMNQGRKFFTKVVPADMGARKAKKFLEDIERSKDEYIKEWMDE